MSELPDDKAILALQKRDLLDQIQDREVAHQRHMMWAVLGVSPGAVIPLLVSMSRIGVAALVGAVFLMTGVEAWRAIKAKREVAALKATFKELCRG